MNNSELTANYFISSLSHELRTPLNGIVGYTQLLLQTKTDNTQKTYLNSMNQCCLQLVELINDILDFSKLSTGKVQLNHECFSIGEIIGEINSTIGYKIKEKRQKYRYILSKDIPKYIIMDKQKLIQVLINLISNANKFTGIEGRILLHVYPIENNMLEFSVEDNGIGISEENQHKLFDAFFQVQESLTKSGSGLGLSICKRIVSLLGGRIWVESEKGNGSVFIFTVKYESYEKFKQQVERVGTCIKDKYILIVDDNVHNRLIISEMIFECNMKPVICSSAMETLYILSKKRYDFSASLIDICMPDIPGTDLARIIKEQYPELPLIAMSSLDEPFDQTNFDYTLNKPIDRLKLLDSICKVILKNDIGTCQLQDSEKKNIEPRMDVNILVVEDIPHNLNMLIKMIEIMGYNRIDTATNGKDAISKIENSVIPYDILLLDLKMPVMDGFSVIEYIRNNEYDYLQIAVLTASVIEDDRERCKNLGVKYFILKPINMTHLRMVLKYMSSE